MSRWMVAGLGILACAGCGGRESETSGTGGGKTGGCPGEALDRSFGGDANKVHVDGLSVAVDRECNLVIAGMAEGAIDLGGGAVGAAGDPFVFVVKLDPQGKHLWSKALPAGTWLSGKRVLGLDSHEEIVLGGYTRANVDLGGGALGGKFDQATQIFLLRLGPGGEHVASKLLPGNAPADVGYSGGFARAIRSVVVDASDSVVIAGEFQGAVDFGGTTLSSVPLVQQDQPTDYKPDVFVVRYDATGHLAFAGRLGGDNYDTRPGLDVTKSGDIVLAYSHAKDSMAADSTSGIHVLKLAPNGDVRWSRTPAGALGSMTSLSVAATDEEGLVVGGQGSMSFAPIGSFTGAFAGRLSAGGDPQVAYQIDGGGVGSVLPDANGGLRAAGWFAKDMLVSGKVAATSAGGLDAFDAHLEWKADATAVSAFGDSQDQAAVAEVVTPDGTRVIVGVEGVVSSAGGDVLSAEWGNRLFVRRR